MQRLFASLLALSNSVASLWVMALMLLITADVVGRGFFNMPIPGVPEIVKFSIVAMFWLQIAYTLRTGKHLRATLLLGVETIGRPRRIDAGPPQRLVGDQVADARHTSLIE